MLNPVQNIKFVILFHMFRNGRVRVLGLEGLVRVKPNALFCSIPVIPDPNTNCDLSYTFLNVALILNFKRNPIWQENHDQQHGESFIKQDPGNRTYNSAQCISRNIKTKPAVIHVHS